MLTPVAILVAEAARSSVGAVLAASLPSVTRTSMLGGVVAFFTTGVTWMPASKSENVRPTTSAASFRAFELPGVVSSNCAPPLLPLVEVSTPFSPHGSQFKCTPFMIQALVVNFWRNSTQ